jgi:hypothetical protein
MSYTKNNKTSNIPDKINHATGESMSAEEFSYASHINGHELPTCEMNTVPWKDKQGIQKIQDCLDWIPEDVYIAGGCVAACLYGNLGDANDIDIFFKDLQQFTRVVNRLTDLGYYVEDPNDLNLLQKEPYKLNYINMLPGPLNMLPVDKPIQLIKRQWHNSCYDVIRHFDLLHCRVGIAYHAFGGKTVTHMFYQNEGAVKANLDKKLLICGTANVSTALHRIDKYKKRGFTTLDELVEAPPTEPERVTKSFVDQLFEKATTSSGKFDNKEYWDDYCSMEPGDFKRKWG